MIIVNGTALFWFITLGLLTGFIFGTLMKKEGISVLANILWGILSSVFIGLISSAFGVGDGLLYAFVYTIALLFIVNVFHQHHEEDLFGHVDRGIRIKKS